MRRIRRWLRIGVLLAVIGIRRMARRGWPPAFLLTGGVLLILGLTLRNSVALIFGIMVMGAAAPGAGPRSADAAMVRTWMRLHKDR